MRALASSIVVILALVLAPMRPAHAAYDPGWFSAYVIPFLLACEAAFIGIIQQISKNMVEVTFQGASAQATLQTEKVLSTWVEVAKGKEVAAVQTQLQADAARIREVTRLPPMACQILSHVKTASIADVAAKMSLNDSVAAMEKHVLETPNAAAAVSKLASAAQRLRKDSSPSPVGFLKPRVYSPTEDEAAQVFMKSVLEPLPIETVPKSWTSTLQGRDFDMARTFYEHKLSAASFSMETAYAARKPVSDEAVKAAENKAGK